MVNVGDKPLSDRVAIASATVEMQPDTLAKIQSGAFQSRAVQSDSTAVRNVSASKGPLEEGSATGKGNVLEVARLAGIMAAKQTPQLIPLCHVLPLDAVGVDFHFHSDKEIRVRARVQVHARTGVEMEALTAVSVAALTIYDMCKSVDRSMRIGDIQLDFKSGGRSGVYQREGTVT